jgi:hypothetical protein
VKIKNIIMKRGREETRLTRVVSLAMRPRNLKEMVGQEEMCREIRDQFKSGRVPHFFIIHGDVGCGKTTLARIIALALQCGKDMDDLDECDWSMYGKYEITEINAANKNGVDDVRALVEGMKYKPIAPSRVRVAILDEAHQLTAAAQNTLITETEDVSNYVFYIFCTSNVSKIIPALQRRAHMLVPKSLTTESVNALLLKVKMFLEIEDEFNLKELIEVLEINNVTTAGCVVQAAEKFFMGVPAHECVGTGNNSLNPKINSLSLCRAVAAGNYTNVCVLFADVTKNDVHALRACILGYLKTILLKTGRLQVAIAIKYLSENSDDSLPMFLASLCFACDQINK